MREIKIFGRQIISWGQEKQVVKAPDEKPIKPRDVRLPAKRVSQPSHTAEVIGLEGEDQILQPHFFLGVIPIIRTLCYTNPNMSQSLNNIVELGNTGHNIQFDAAVEPDMINKMRAHIETKQKEWSESNAGIDGLVNRFISQIVISGALSVEWVPNMSLTGLKGPVLVNPELVRWGYNKQTRTYEAFQYAMGGLIDNPTSNNNLIRLNPNTFKYYALNGDTDNPYGIPPYIPALDPVKTQKLMMDNIKFIVETVGVLGFLEVLMDKPTQNPGETYDAYVARLNQFLVDARTRVQEGYRDGVTVGYKDDTEFEFHSTTKNFVGINELFQLNEIALSSGLKMDPSMLGRNYGASESQITIVFTKLLSQLKNVQNLVKASLEYGYSLELRLAGFKFDSLTVVFNPSTALDELKVQQAEEIKIRNQNALWQDGVTSQEQYAHKLGYEKPNQKKPRYIRGQVQTDAEIKAKRIADKNKSAKGVRKKNKPQEKKLGGTHIDCPYCTSSTPNSESGMGYIVCKSCKKPFSSQTGKPFN